MAEGEGVTAVTFRDNAITIEYESGPPSSRPGTFAEARVMADRFFGSDQTLVEVFGGHQWVRGA